MRSGFRLLNTFGNCGPIERTVACFAFEGQNTIHKVIFWEMNVDDPKVVRRVNDFGNSDRRAMLLCELLNIRRHESSRLARGWVIADGVQDLIEPLANALASCPNRLEVGVDSGCVQSGQI